MATIVGAPLKGPVFLRYYSPAMVERMEKSWKLDPANYPAVKEEAEQVGKGGKREQKGALPPSTNHPPLLRRAGAKPAGAQRFLIKWHAKSLSKGILLLLLRVSSLGEILIDFELHW